MSVAIVQYDNPFRLSTQFEPKGDQAKAIEGLVDGLDSGYRFQTLLGATGTGKTYTMASVIAQAQRPALVIAHNKTLAAQLCQEFRAFFPENSVQYFISYYDYYQPEAYVPQTDTYIEKDSSVNEEIDRLRHAATQAILERRDVVIVASVSCIYGLGSPDTYAESVVTFETGAEFHLDEALAKLVSMQFVRNDMVLDRGTFRVRGDTLEIQPKDEEVVTRVEFFGDTVERIRLFDPLTQEVLDEPTRCSIFPATHYVTPWERLDEVSSRLPYSKAKASSSKPNAFASAWTSTSRCFGSWAIATESRTTLATSMGASQVPRPTLFSTFYLRTQSFS
jgi:excinuclease ABC subunit B